MFRSCDLQVNAPFHDSTGSRGPQIISTYRILGAQEESGLYVLVRAHFSPRREVIVREIEFAGIPSESDGCDLPGDYVVVARGRNPDWRVLVQESGVEFSEGEVSLRFPPVTASGAGLYETTLVAGESHTLRLKTERTPCNEGNNAYGAMRAEVEIDGRAMTGCAWHGKVP
jgi:uncharacterized membrane protein